MTGDVCGTRYGVRLHLAEDTRLCADCATIVTDALTPGVERERRTPTRTETPTPNAVERDLRALVGAIHQAFTTPADPKAIRTDDRPQPMDARRCGF